MTSPTSQEQQNYLHQQGNPVNIGFSTVRHDSPQSTGSNSSTSGEREGDDHHQQEQHHHHHHHHHASSEDAKLANLGQLQAMWKDVLSEKSEQAQKKILCTRQMRDLFTILCPECDSLAYKQTFGDGSSFVSVLCRILCADTRAALRSGFPSNVASATELLVNPLHTELLGYLSTVSDQSFYPEGATQHAFENLNRILTLHNIPTMLVALHTAFLDCTTYRGAPASTPGSQPPSPTRQQQQQQQQQQQSWSLPDEAAISEQKYLALLSAQLSQNPDAVVADLQASNSIIPLFRTFTVCLHHPHRASASISEFGMDICCTLLRNHTQHFHNVAPFLINEIYDTILSSLEGGFSAGKVSYFGTAQHARTEKDESLATAQLNTLYHVIHTLNVTVSNLYTPDSDSKDLRLNLVGSIMLALEDTMSAHQRLAAKVLNEFFAFATLHPASMPGAGNGGNAGGGNDGGGGAGGKKSSKKKGRSLTSFFRNAVGSVTSAPSQLSKLIGHGGGLLRGGGSGGDGSDGRSNSPVRVVVNSSVIEAAATFVSCASDNRARAMMADKLFHITADSQSVEMSENIRSYVVHTLLVSFQQFDDKLRCEVLMMLEGLSKRDTFPMQPHVPLLVQVIEKHHATLSFRCLTKILSLLTGLCTREDDSALTQAVLNSGIVPLSCQMLLGWALKPAKRRRRRRTQEGKEEEQAEDETSRIVSRKEEDDEEADENDTWRKKFQLQFEMHQQKLQGGSGVKVDDADLDPLFEMPSLDFPSFVETLATTCGGSNNNNAVTTVTTTTTASGAAATQMHQVTYSVETAAQQLTLLWKVLLRVFMSVKVSEDHLVVERLLNVIVVGTERCKQLQLRQRGESNEREEQLEEEEEEKEEQEDDGVNLAYRCVRSAVKAARGIYAMHVATHGKSLGEVLQLVLLHSSRPNEWEECLTDILGLIAHCILATKCEEEFIRQNGVELTLSLLPSIGRSKLVYLDCTLISCVLSMVLPVIRFSEAGRMLSVSVPASQQEAVYVIQLMLELCCGACRNSDVVTTALEHVDDINENPTTARYASSDAGTAALREGWQKIGQTFYLPNRLHFEFADPFYVLCHWHRDMRLKYLATGEDGDDDEQIHDDVDNDDEEEEGDAKETEGEAIDSDEEFERTLFSDHGSTNKKEGENDASVEFDEELGIEVPSPKNKDSNKKKAKKTTKATKTSSTSQRQAQKEQKRRLRETYQPICDDLLHAMKRLALANRSKFSQDVFARFVFENKLYDLLQCIADISRHVDANFLSAEAGCGGGDEGQFAVKSAAGSPSPFFRGYHQAVSPAGGGVCVPIPKSYNSLLWWRSAVLTKWYRHMLPPSRRHNHHSQQQPQQQQQQQHQQHHHDPTPYYYASSPPTSASPTKRLTTTTTTTATEISSPLHSIAVPTSETPTTTAPYSASYVAAGASKTATSQQVATAGLMSPGPTNASAATAAATPQQQQQQPQQQQQQRIPHLMHSPSSALAATSTTYHVPIAPCSIHHSIEIAERGGIFGHISAGTEGWPPSGDGYTVALWFRWGTATAEYHCSSTQAPPSQQQAQGRSATTTTTTGGGGSFGLHDSFGPSSTSVHEPTPNASIASLEHAMTAHHHQQQQHHHEHEQQQQQQRMIISRMHIPVFSLSWIDGTSSSSSGSGSLATTRMNFRINGATGQLLMSIAYGNSGVGVGNASSSSLGDDAKASGGSGAATSPSSASGSSASDMVIPLGIVPSGRWTHISIVHHRNTLFPSEMSMYLDGALSKKHNVAYPLNVSQLAADQLNPRQKKINVVFGYERKEQCPHLRLGFGSMQIWEDTLSPPQIRSLFAASPHALQCSEWGASQLPKGLHLFSAPVLCEEAVRYLSTLVPETFDSARVLDVELPPRNALIMSLHPAVADKAEAAFRYLDNKDCVLVNLVDPSELPFILQGSYSEPTLGVTDPLHVLLANGGLETLVDWLRDVLRPPVLVSSSCSSSSLPPSNNNVDDEEASPCLSPNTLLSVASPTTCATNAAAARKAACANATILGIAQNPSATFALSTILRAVAVSVYYGQHWKPLRNSRRFMYVVAGLLHEQPKCVHSVDLADDLLGLGIAFIGSPFGPATSSGSAASGSSSDVEGMNNAPEASSVQPKTPASPEATPTTTSSTTTTGTLKSYPIVFNSAAFEMLLFHWRFLRNLHPAILRHILVRCTDLFKQDNPYARLNAERVVNSTAFAGYMHGLVRGVVTPPSVLSVAVTLVELILGACGLSRTLALSELLTFITATIPLQGDETAVRTRLGIRSGFYPPFHYLVLVRNMLLRSLCHVCGTLASPNTAVLDAALRVLPHWWICVATDKHSHPVTATLALQFFALLLTRPSFRQKVEKGGVFKAALNGLQHHAFQPDVLATVLHAAFALPHDNLVFYYADTDVSSTKLVSEIAIAKALTSSSSSSSSSLIGQSGSGGSQCTPQLLSLFVSLLKHSMLALTDLTLFLADLDKDDGESESLANDAPITVTKPSLASAIQCTTYFSQLDRMILVRVNRLRVFGWVVIAQLRLKALLNNTNENENNDEATTSTTNQQQQESLEQPRSPAAPISSSATATFSNAAATAEDPSNINTNTNSANAPFSVVTSRQALKDEQKRRSEMINALLQFHTNVCTRHEAVLAMLFQQTQQASVSTHPIDTIVWLLMCALPFRDIHATHSGADQQHAGGASASASSNSGGATSSQQQQQQQVIADTDEGDDDDDGLAATTTTTVTMMQNSALPQSSSTVFSTSSSSHALLSFDQLTSLSHGDAYPLVVHLISSLVERWLFQGAQLATVPASSTKNTVFVLQLHHLLCACPHGVGDHAEAWYASQVIAAYLNASLRALRTKSSLTGDTAANGVKNIMSLAGYVLDRLVSGLPTPVEQTIAFLNALHSFLQASTKTAFTDSCKQLRSLVLDWSMFIFSPAYHQCHTQGMAKARDLLHTHGKFLWQGAYWTNELFKWFYARLVEITLNTVRDAEDVHTAEGRRMGELWQRLLISSHRFVQLEPLLIDPGNAAAGRTKIDLLHGGFDIMFQPFDSVDLFLSFLMDNRYNLTEMFKRTNLGRCIVQFSASSGKRNRKWFQRYKHDYTKEQMKQDGKTEEVVTTAFAAWDKLVASETVVDFTMLQYDAQRELIHTLERDDDEDDGADATFQEESDVNGDGDGDVGNEDEKDAGAASAAPEGASCKGHATKKLATRTYFDNVQSVYSQRLRSVNPLDNYRSVVGAVPVACHLPQYGSSVTHISNNQEHPLLSVSNDAYKLNANLLLRRIACGECGELMPVYYVGNVYFLAGTDSVIATLIITSIEIIIVTSSQCSENGDFFIAAPRRHEAADKKKVTSVVESVIRRFLPRAPASAVLSSSSMASFRHSQYYRQLRAEKQRDTFSYVWRFQLSTVDRAIQRRFQHQSAGLEFVVEFGHRFFIVALDHDLTMSKAERGRIVGCLHQVSPWVDIENTALQRARVQAAQKKWLKRQLGTFDYLMLINDAASRTPVDLSQYPIVPWTLSDYDAESIDVNNASSYRDFSKPMGALDTQRANEVVDRYANWCDDNCAPFHFGTHYSTSATVMYYLVRQSPFTELSIQYQGGKRLDVPDRLFHSVCEAWISSSGGSRGSDVKELVPEFFFTSDFLKNLNQVELGTKRDGTTLNHVVLPPWAHGSVHKFTSLMRAAIEGEHCGNAIHQWIDLVFGYKQQGEEAVKAVNVFHHLSYDDGLEKAMGSAASEEERKAIVGQVEDFGLTPKLVFKNAHPKRGPAQQPPKQQLVLSLAGTYQRRGVSTAAFATPSVSKNHRITALYELDSTIYCSTRSHIFTSEKPLLYFALHSVSSSLAAFAPKEHSVAAVLPSVTESGLGKINLFVVSPLGNVVCASTTRSNSICVFQRRGSCNETFSLVRVIRAPQQGTRAPLSPSPSPSPSSAREGRGGGGGEGAGGVGRITMLKYFPNGTLVVAYENSNALSAWCITCHTTYKMFATPLVSDDVPDDASEIRCVDWGSAEGDNKHRLVVVKESSIWVLDTAGEILASTSLLDMTFNSSNNNNNSQDVVEAAPSTATASQLANSGSALSLRQRASSFASPATQGFKALLHTASSTVGSGAASPHGGEGTTPTDGNNNNDGGASSPFLAASPTTNMSMLSSLQEPLTCVAFMSFPGYSLQSVVLCGHQDGAVSFWALTTNLDCGSDKCVSLSFTNGVPPPNADRQVAVTALLTQPSMCSFVAGFEDGSLVHHTLQQSIEAMAGGGGNVEYDT